MDRHGRRKMPLGLAPRKLARGLGWLSLGLGFAELAMPRTLARTLGMRRDAGLVAACGLREIATGIGILKTRNPRPWLWARVAGDALDLATLAGRTQGKRVNVALAMGAVAGVTVVDTLCATSLPTSPRPKEAIHDYSDRSGLPRPPAEMRGVARPDWADTIPAGPDTLPH